MRGANMVDEGVGAAAGLVGGTGHAAYRAGMKVLEGHSEEALPTLSGGLASAAEGGAKEGARLEAFGAGWEAAAAATPPPPPVAAAGGGDAAEAARLAAAAADAKAQAAANAAAAAAAPAAGAGAGAGGPAAAAAGPAITADDEEKRKLIELQKANPEARVEVFCDEDDQKKRQYDAKLEKFLGDDLTYKKNEKSAFICFISPSDTSNTNETLLPYVTNGDFLKILAKDSFPKYSNKGIRICKMDLDPSDKGVVMGSSKLKEQHWIDVKDEKNTTRIFIDKENFQNLAEYKNLLTAKFEEFLRGDFSKVLSASVNSVADKETIKNAIDGFGIVQDIVDKTGAVAPAASQTSVALKLGIRDEEIQKKAQEFAEDFLQRRIMKGNLNCEKETTSAVIPATFENQEIGHIKIVRPLADQKKIEVYKVGNSNLEHVNLALDQEKIMQIPISGITADGIKDVKYYKVGDSKELSKNEIGKEALKVKVNVFVKGDHEWTGYKISEGGDQSKGESKKVVTPFEGVPLEKVPKIFTIGKDEKSVTIGKGSGWKLGYVPLGNCVGNADVEIKIRRSKDGNYKIQYGENKLFDCCSWLSYYKGAYLINPDITEIVGVTNSNSQPEKLGFKKRGTILSNPFFCCRSGKFDKFKIEVEDQKLNKMVTLEVEKVGIRREIFGARNNFMVKEVSSRALPVTVLDAPGVVSTTPGAAPAPAKASCWPAFLGRESRSPR
jgi:hypothetical protein